MILCAGLTPAWQQILVFDRLTLGDVNRATRVAWCASGKVVNAGIAANQLGVSSVVLAPAGGPPLERMREELAQLGATARWIETRAATRTCTTLLDRGSGLATELVENAPALTTDELDRYAEAMAEEAARAKAVVLTGSLPEGADPSYYDRLIERIPCPVVCDFRGPGLLKTLARGPLVVKPNRGELAETVGRDLPDDASLVAAMRELNAMGAQWVVVTDGARPVWVSSSTSVFQALGPPVAPEAVVNPIGCGDAMAAALAVAVPCGTAMPDAVRFAIAAAQENLLQLLPCRFAAEEVRRRAADVIVRAWP